MPNIKDLSKLQLQQYLKVLDNVNLADRALAKQYLIVLNSIESQLIKLSDKDGKLSYAEATQFNRLKKLDEHIKKTLNELLDTNVEIVNNLLRKDYYEAYYRYSWATDQHFSINLDWGLLNPKVIEKSLENPLMKIAWKNYAKSNYSKVKTAITQGLIKGDSYQNIAKELKKALNTGYNRTIRIARTEGHRVTEQAIQEQFEYARDELQIDLRKRLVATLDDRTRQQSVQTDGEISNEEGMFQYPDGNWYYPGNTNHAEWDINDRCVSVQMIEDAGPIVRRTKEDGVIPYQNFEDWAKEKGLTHNIYGEKLF